MRPSLEKSCFNHLSYSMVITGSDLKNSWFTLILEARTGASSFGKQQDYLQYLKRVQSNSLHSTRPHIWEEWDIMLCGFQALVCTWVKPIISTWREPCESLSVNRRGSCVIQNMKLSLRY
jgi:hypothetical protein